MASVPSSPLPIDVAPQVANAPHPFYADLYTFDWSQLIWIHPLVSALCVALCLVIGVLVGHPAAGLIAGGGAFTVGFGPNQRIRDSRVWPMLAASLAVAVSTVVGMLVGHRGYGVLLASTLWGFGYALLTTKANGVSWVGQQATVFLLVTSAFPTNLHGALSRASLTLLGGLLQTLATSIGLRMLPELEHHLAELPHQLYRTLYQERSATFAAVRALPLSLPAIEISGALGFAIRMVLTLLLSSAIYRRLGIQSGYWIPMTALLVQKPAFFETLTRGLLRVVGTFAGAVLGSMLLIHLRPTPLELALLASFCAFWAYVTNRVNYGLFSLCLTAYIVFLLGLNAIPGPQIAHRRAYCTALGAAIALVIHVDALRRHRKAPTTA